MRRGIAAGVAAALMFAAMLVGSFGVLLESGLRAHGQLDRYAGAVAVVARSQSVSHTTGSGESKQTETRPLTERARIPDAEAEAARLRAVPGVTGVVKDVSVPVVDDRGRQLTGHGWESAALTGAPLGSGRAPVGDRQVVLPATDGATVGATVQLQTDGGPQPFTVSGLVNGGGDVYFSQSYAAALSGHPGSADALVVLGGPGTSVAALQQAAPDRVVATGAARGDVEHPAVPAARADLIGICGSIGGVALMVTLLVVTSLLEMSVRDRVRELAVMRAVGATPRQVRRLIVRGTLKVAVPAAAVGGVLSLGSGALLHRLMTSRGGLPPELALTPGPLPVVGGMLVTVLAAVGAAWLAARRVSRIRPVEALGEAATEPTRLPRWRMVTGLVFLVLGLAMAAVAFTLGGQAAVAAMSGLVMSLIWATALLGPWIARGGIRLLSMPLRLVSPVSGRLASDGARAAAVRMATVITPIALAVSFGAGQLFVQTSVVNATRVQATVGLRADQVLVSDGPGIPHRAYQAAQQTVGQAPVTAVKRTTVVKVVGSQLQSLAAQGIEGSTATLDPDVTSGSLAGLARPNTVALGADVAGGTEVGTTTSLRLGDGTEIHPEVVAVYGSSLGFGSVLLPRAEVAAHSTDAALDDYLLVGGHADLKAVTDTFRGVHTTSAPAYGEALTERARQSGLVGLLASAAIAGFIMIGVVTTLAVSTASRRRELSLLRLVGATRRQLLRMLRMETAVVVGTGTVVGALVAAATLLTFGGAVTGLATLAISPALCAGIVGAVAVAGAAAVLLPARGLLRGGSPKID
ncbi:putative ABC transport system permease protein [Kitasatospora gansuensis]|uniref:Putative ABC transport system permease protein n=1 Tax=Kitasatospora gansuensis TaxID=258050 RepID=A0A7W7WG17_9ACTN|nr:ABC transporter permease [Kitasatospora gansuensis]MBB4945165.1 putative ABC transport system permease protein [Kitasatospora gansuensis]